MRTWSTIQLVIDVVEEAFDVRIQYPSGRNLPGRLIEDLRHRISREAIFPEPV